MGPEVRRNKIFELISLWVTSNTPYFGISKIWSAVDHCTLKFTEILKKNSSKFSMINKTEIVQISYNTGRLYDVKKDAKFYIDLRVATFLQTILTTIKLTKIKDQQLIQDQLPAIRLIMYCIELITLKFVYVSYILLLYL